MRFLIAAVCILMSAVCVAAEPTKAYLRDGKIIIESDGKTRVIDSNRGDQYVDYPLKKWTVREQRDPVAEALKVFNAKGEKAYQKRLWFIDNQDGDKKIYVEYATAPGIDRLVMTPDERYAYYLGLAPAGETVLYGLDLTGEKNFKVAVTGDFRVVDCPRDQKSYIVVESDGKQRQYIVYTAEGEQKDIVSGAADFSDLTQYVCY